MTKMMSLKPRSKQTRKTSLPSRTLLYMMVDSQLGYTKRACTI